MIHKLYTIISIWGATGILFVLAFCFMFLAVPDNSSLRNYRIARRTMACAYLFFGLINIVEYWGHTTEVNVSLVRMVTLVIACSQAFLFTFTLITLINIRFVTRRRLLGELLPVLAFMVAAFVIYFRCPASCFQVFFYFFIAFYLCLLIRYTYLFRTHYSTYLTYMDNYFADQETQRLQWVAFSFYAALVIGVMALLSAIFMYPLGSLVFSVVLIFFYTYFAIRLINYVYLFPSIETVLEEVSEEGDGKLTEPDGFALEIYSVIDEKLQVWVAEKQFTEKGITLDYLARKLYTNRKYLSSYFNVHKKMTFRDWINRLRIQEAQHLLRSNPGMTMNEAALQTGFTDRSNFRRQFTRQTGLSPATWREQVCR